MEKKKLKISLLLPNRGMGGGVRSTARVGNELLSLGHFVRIFYRRRAIRFRHRLGNLYRSIRYRPSQDWLTTFKGEVIEYDKLKAVSFSRDELIVSMCAQTTLDMYELPKNLGIKILYCRGAEIENWSKMLESWKLPFPKIVTSSDLSEMINREVGQSIVGVVPNGVDTDVYYPSVPETERLGVGASFRTGQSKDPVSTIRIMLTLRDKLPDIPYYMYSSARRPRGLQNVCFTYLPTISEAREIYSHCKVWFLTSIKEGFGNPVLEAMACGCVVVSTNCGGPGDIIKDGVNGFLVDVGNTGAMVHKIELLYRDEKLRKQMSLNALETAKQFTWSESISKLERYFDLIYNKTISSKQVT